MGLQEAREGMRGCPGRGVLVEPLGSHHLLRVMSNKTGNLDGHNESLARFAAVLGRGRDELTVGTPQVRADWARGPSQSHLRTRQPPPKA